MTMSGRARPFEFVLEDDARDSVTAVTHNTPGFYSFVVPQGVRNIKILIIGGGREDLTMYKRQPLSVDDKAAVREALDKLAIALTGTGHIWTDAERDAYERAIALLD